MNRCFAAACLACLACLVLVPAAALAQGDPVADIERSNQYAVENLDLGEIDAAKKTLIEALAKLEAYGLGNKPAAGRTHMLLGLIYAQGLGDPGRGLKHLVRALELDETTALDGHASDASKALWAQAQQTVNPVIDCTTLEGIAHKRVVASDEGKAVPVSVKLGAALHEGAVELHYKPAGAGEFTTLAMARQGDCEFVATVPAARVVPGALLYYVLVKTAAGKTAAASGSEARPILIEVSQKVVTQETQTEIKRQEDEVPDALQVGKGKGSGCGGCGVGGPGQGMVGLGAAVGLAMLASGLRRRRAARPRS